jgi:hypothetical protein
MTAYAPHNLQFRYNDPRFCHSCGGDTFPVKDTHIGPVCSDCRVLCSYCEDWLMGHAITVDGKRYHPECAEDMRDNAIATEPVDNACVVCGWDGCKDCLSGINPGGAMGTLEVCQ